MLTYRTVLLAFAHHRGLRLGSARPDHTCASKYVNYTGAGALQLPEKSATPLKDIIEQVQAVEWRDLLESGSFENLEADIRSNLHQLAPADLVHNTALKGLSPGLLKAVLEITARQTVFIIDNSELGVAPDDDHHKEDRASTKSPLKEAAREDLIDKIGHELFRNQQLMLGGRVAFVPFRAGAGESRRYEALTRRLLAQITSTSISDEALRDGPVLLVGETGAGKTEQASAIHQALIARTGRKGRFMPINVAAISPSLLESRLRGYRKGTFTGADGSRDGWFADANEGTLFLDEFQSAPPEIQLQLLDLMRAVSDNVRVSKIGDEANPGTYRVKLILATNEPVEKLRTEARLRVDLFYRVRTLIEVRPLRKRIIEEAELLESLWCLNRWRSNAPWIGEGADDTPSRDRELRLAVAPALTSEARQVLSVHGWPGNLREFERVCFDVFWEYDRASGLATDWADMICRAIGLDMVTEDESLPKSGSPDRATMDRLREAEQILIDCQFTVRRAQPLLAKLKLKSYRTLKAFLTANRQFLVSPHWEHDSRARALLDKVDG
jgi:energy-coupling factor transporter ATP-binding protein EcfA2